MENCLFCKIAKGKIPSNTIYEDEDVLAFLDIEPATKGHTLIIPKKHSKNILDINPEELKKINVVSQKIAKHYKKNIPECKGINIIQSSEAAAQQEVMHYHMHVVPRYQDDKRDVWKQMKIKKIDIDLERFTEEFTLC